MDHCELILALDVDDQDEALKTLKALGPNLRWVKIGLQLFTRNGPDIIHAIADLGYDLFLDLKLHDIPNTVAKSVANLAKLPVKLTTLHVLGGPEMLKAANEARLEHNPDLNLLGVTVLTSMDRAQLAAIGFDDSTEEEVLRLANLGLESGLQGLVCAPLEIDSLRETLGSSCILVTPGIRPTGFATDDQKRAATPLEAARQGASYVVVGRPILRADDPRKVIDDIYAELKSGSEARNA